MSSDATNSGKDAKQSSAIDLSELQALSFGPDWSSGKSITTNFRESRDGGRRGAGRRDGAGQGKGRDRRPDRRPERSRHDAGNDAGGRPPRGDDRRRDRRSAAPQHEEFEPVVEALFYPEDIPFKALCHAIKASCRTYELFELARLILSKPDRFVVVVKPLAGAPGVTDRFTLSVPDGLPFETEESAMSHIMQAHLDKFFTTEEVEIDPPKGSFQMINKCGVTGVLLGPPNYHRYQSLLADHHAARLPDMSFERFTQKIEAVKEQEIIDEWLKQMSRVIRYKVISPREGEPEYLDGIEAARHFLLSKRRSEVVRDAEQVRISGKSLEALPDGPIAKSIKAMLDKQQRFPLDTANNLRGRLRRMKFTIYKRGSKGVSYVCAVKRSFRSGGTVFSESLQELIDFIENHQYINVSQLPEKFLGISIASPAPTPPPEKAPAIEKVPEEEAAKIVEAHEKSRLAEQEEPVSTGPAPAPAPQPKVEAAQFSEEDKQVSQLLADLRWLVVEGYVTEFADGRLFANPPAPEVSAKPEKAEPEAPAEAAPEATAEPAPEAEKPADEPKLAAPTPPAPIVAAEPSTEKEEPPTVEPEAKETAETESDEKAQSESKSV